MQEAYVIGIPSEYYGEEVMACVRLAGHDSHRG